MCDNIDKESLGSEGHFGLTDLQDRKWFIYYVSGPAADVLAYYIYAEYADDSSVYKCSILLKGDYTTVGDMKKDLIPDLTREATSARPAQEPIKVRSDLELDSELTKALQLRYPGEEVVCHKSNNEHSIRFRSGLFGYFGINSGNFEGEIYKDTRACDNGEEALFHEFIATLIWEPNIETTFIPEWDMTVINIYMPANHDTIVTYHMGNTTEADTEYFAQQAIDKYKAEMGLKS